jgi:hypothetical protein
MGWKARRWDQADECWTDVLLAQRSGPPCQYPIRQISSPSRYREQGAGVWEGGNQDLMKWLPSLLDREFEVPTTIRDGGSEAAAMQLSNPGPPEFTKSLFLEFIPFVIFVQCIYHIGASRPCIQASSSSKIYVASTSLDMHSHMRLPTAVNANTVQERHLHPRNQEPYQNTSRCNATTAPLTWRARRSPRTHHLGSS